MSINTTCTARAVIAAVAIALAGCAGTATRTGEYVDDSMITTKVKEAMAVDKDVSAHDISVTTNNGVVHLTGVAHSRAEAQKAVQLARNVAGVRSVENSIEIR
jgi:osmotically-inducible protein OsmY